MRCTGFLAVILAAAVLSSCAAPRTARPRGPALVKLKPSEYPSFTYNKDPIELAFAVENSVSYYGKLPPDAKVSFGPDIYTASEMRDGLSRFREFLLSGPSEGLLREYVSKYMEVYASSGYDGEGSVLFTGYYLPEIRASKARGALYRWPVYALPGDIAGGPSAPFFSRGEIESGALSGRGLELAWCRDPVDVFFLHIQGSGVLDFEDGGKAHINYAGANGRAYRSIGKLLLERGRATRGQMSMDFLRDFLHAHPDEAREVMDYNESYVFFRLEDEGPYGCLGAPVTAGCSIATDIKTFPPGALAFLETEAPLKGAGAGVSGWAAYRGFFMNQDTGGAIKGPGRADIYFGSGEDAAFRAGFMNRKGRLYFLAGKR